MPVARRVPLLGGLALAGCSLLGPVEQPVTSAVLDRLPDEVPRASRGLETLLVHRVESPERIDTRQMAYSLRPHHFAYFSRNEWAERPARMLQPLLVRTLEATDRFAAVVTPPASGAHFALRTELADLLQDFGGDAPLLRLALRLRLVEERGHRTVGVRVIELQQAMRQGTPHAGVVAANAAVARALREVAVFVVGTVRT